MCRRVEPADARLACARRTAGLTSFCGAICGPTMVTSAIGRSAHCGGSIPAASAAMRAQ